MNVFLLRLKIHMNTSLLIFVSFAFLCWTNANLVQFQYVVNTGGKIFNFLLNLVFLL
jgi:hypothetical protein